MIIQGDCIDKLKELDDNSIDSVVTDPPYGLEFMGKKWDYDVPSVEIWQEVIRVMKPGAFLLSFAGTRTHHRMAVNIEDAGFEIRDMIAWVYGSGFPKSHNIGKAVDKLQGNEREDLGKSKYASRASKSQPYGQGEKGAKDTRKVTKGNSPWEGWGTALKPALEPIVVAQKPREGTFAENVLKWGVGGINIDGSRIGKKKGDRTEYGVNGIKRKTGNVWGKQYGKIEFDGTQGRFPANFIHDGSEEVERLLGSADRFFYCAKASKSERNKGLEGFEDVEEPKIYADDKWSKEHMGNTPAVKRKPVKNNHPTVKPISLMRYLVKLVTPPEGTVLDPFVGSGTTGIACKLEDFKFIGIEREEEYVKIAKARIQAYQAPMI